MTHVGHHRRRRVPWTIAAVSVVWLAGLALVPAAEPDLEARARKIDGRLMAPCCMANTVAEHNSGPSFEMRREIREMLAAGKSEQEILDHYVAVHGDLILAAPPSRGFNLVAYLLPVLLLLVGVVSMLVVVRRWSRAPAPELPTPDLAPLDPEDAERLRRAVQEYDSTS